MYTSAAVLAVMFLQLPQSVSVPAGAVITAKLESTVTTASSRQGDEITAAVVRGLPGGSRLHGRVETIQSATPDAEGRVRLVFREIEFRDGQRVQTWITNSFTAGTPKRGLRYVVYTAAGATAGALAGGKRARVTGLLGGTILGLVIAARPDPGPKNLTLKAGREIRLELTEDLVLGGRISSPRFSISHD
jgi:hypothetical protein